MMIRVPVAAAFALVSNVALGQGGAVPVRIPNLDNAGAQRCINAKNDKIWLTLRRVVTTKGARWFTQDNAVAGILSAAVRADPQPPKPIVFPLMTEATLRDYGSGQVSVPLEYTIVSGLNLTQTGVSYTGLNVDITLLNRRGRNAWGSALASLNEITKKLPIPPSPLTQAGSYLMDFANAAVTKDIESQASEDKFRTATLSLNFDPTGACGARAADGSDFETTGTIAILHEGGVQGADLIPVNRTNDYCWAAELKPAFVLKAAKKEAAVPCADARYAQRYRQVTNNYIGFFLNAVRSTGVSGPVIARDRDQSVARCLANGFRREDCLR